jgi:L-fuconolactonase
MPDFLIIDAHVHLCNVWELKYSWTKDAPQLGRNVSPAELKQAAGPVQIEKFIFVEVDVDSPHQLTEAAWIESLKPSTPELGGMVASLPLELGAAIEEDIIALKRHSLLRGIRRLIQKESDPEFCLQPRFIDGLKLLAKHDLSFDICIYHHQFPSVLKMVAQCPEVAFVLDHIGKPGIKAGLFEPWATQIKELARFPNVACKISGVITEADHKTWTREQVKPYIAHAIDCFGFDRAMFGSDWHVQELAGTYPGWIDVVDWVVAGASADEKRKLYRDTAKRVYRLG